MTPTEIYGLLLIRGHRAPDVARLVGVSESMVREVVQGRRAGGPDARRVRSWISDALGLPEEHLWPPEQEPPNVVNA